MYRCVITKLSDFKVECVLMYRCVITKLSVSLLTGV